MCLSPSDRRLLCGAYHVATTSALLWCTRYFVLYTIFDSQSRLRNRHVKKLYFWRQASQWKIKWSRRSGLIDILPRRKLWRSAQFSGLKRCSSLLWMFYSLHTSWADICSARWLLNMQFCEPALIDPLWCVAFLLLLASRRVWSQVFRLLSIHFRLEVGFEFSL